jgi:hypothetical protein
MKYKKNHQSERIFIAGFFTRNINDPKSAFWLNSVKAKARFESLYVLNASETDNVAINGFEELFFPAWLRGSKIKAGRFCWGIFSLMALLFQNPKFLIEVIALEFKAMPLNTNSWGLGFLKRMFFLLKTVCGLGQVFIIFHKLDLGDQDTVVVWSEHFSGMRLLKREVKRSKSRLVLSEYGEIPGTMFICDRGMFHESWPLRYKQQFGSLPINVDEIDQVQRYIHNIVCERISSKTGQYAVDDTLEALDIKKGKPIIYINGIQPHASGLLPRCSEFSKEYSPYFGSNDAILRYFSQLAEKHDWIVLFKDHPNTCNYFAGQELRDEGLSEHVKILGNVDIYKVLRVADLTVSLGSKTVFLSLLNEVPVFLLGPYSISPSDLKSGVYRGGDSEEAIVSVVESARRDGVDSEGLTLYLARMMKYYYYSMDDDADSLFGRGKQQFWEDFHDYMAGGRSVISAKVNFNGSTKK